MKRRVFLVSVVLTAAGCPDSSSNGPCSPQEAGVGDAGVSASDLLRGKPFGWVENDDGKGGKLVDISWTWENPLPQGNRLNEVWGTSLTDVYAVGDHGTILHYDGQKWRAEESGTVDDLYDVWGCASKVFAVGTRGAFLQRDTKWVQAESGTVQSLHGVWCADPKQVYVVGAARTILECDSNNCTKQPWSAKATGYREWQEMDQRPLELRTVLGYPCGEVHAGGEEAFVIGNPLGWSALEIGTWDTVAMWGEAHDKVYIADRKRMYCYNGVSTDWGHDVGKDELTSVWGIVGGGVVATTAAGAVLESPDGSTWNDLVDVSKRPLRGVWGISNIYLAVGDAGVMFTQKSGTWQQSWDGSRETMLSISGDPGQGMYVAGRDGIHRRSSDGHWQLEVPTDAIRSLWMASPTSGVAVGTNGTARRLANGKWTLTSTPTNDNLIDVHGNKSGLIVAVGEQGAVLRQDGANWTSIPFPVAADLDAVWVDDGGAVFVAGEECAFGRLDGDKWTQIQVLDTGPIVDIWGTSDKDVYVVSENSIFHYDGTAATRVVGNYPCALTNITGTTTSVFVPSACGSALYRSGDRWVSIRLPSRNRPSGALVSGSALYAVGEHGMVVRGNVQ